MCLMNEFVKRSRITAQLYRITFQSGGDRQTLNQLETHVPYSHHLQDAANMNEFSYFTINVLKGKPMNLWQYEERFYILADEFQLRKFQNHRKRDQEKTISNAHLRILWQMCCSLHMAGDECPF